MAAHPFPLGTMPSACLSIPSSKTSLLSGRRHSCPCMTQVSPRNVTSPENFKASMFGVGLSSSAWGSPLNFKRGFVCNGISGSRDGTSSSMGELGDGFGMGENENRRETRMERVSKALYERFKVRLSDIRERLPAKVFLILFGFFCANTLSTIIGQTGDWDVLVAGILVSLLESLGYIIYGKQNTSYFGPLRTFLKFLNYWKVGLVLGLFVDAFKVGS